MTETIVTCANCGNEIAHAEAWKQVVTYEEQPSGNLVGDVEATGKYLCRDCGPGGTRDSTA